MSEKSVEPRSGGWPPMPRWVKGFVVAGLILASLAVIMMARGHGPGRHFGTAVDDSK
jgi:hypothetical protein